MGAAVLFDLEYRTDSMELDNETIASQLIKKDEAAFELVFKKYFKNLHAYAFTILKDDEMAEEMVQQVFFKLWERSENLSFNSSIQAYLYKAVYHESLNYLKHRKVRSAHQLHIAYSMNTQGEQASKKVITKELETRLRTALNALPEQCRTIFQMSRFEELKYREIADRLNLSVKTVENQMGKALKILRQELVDLLALLILFLIR